MKDTMHKTNSFKKNNLRVGTVPPLSCAGVSRPRSVSTLFLSSPALVSKIEAKELEAV